MLAAGSLPAVYVDPFARIWHGFSTTDPKNRFYFISDRCHFQVEADESCNITVIYLPRRFAIKLAEFSDI